MENVDDTNGVNMNGVDQSTRPRRQHDQDDSETYGSSGIEAASTSAPASDKGQIQAYARLVCRDGDFYLTTLAMELGRFCKRGKSRHYQTSSSPSSKKTSPEDINLSQPSSPTEDTRAPAGNSSAIENAPNGTHRSTPPPPPPTRSDITRKREFYEIDEDDPPPELAGLFTLQEVKQMIEEEPDFNQRDPIDCPLVRVRGFHGDEGLLGSSKSISRRHARIQYNCETYCFELLFTGRNGGFLNTKYYGQKSILPLCHGDIIQIGAAGFRFELAGTQSGQTGAESLVDEDSEVDSAVDDLALVQSGSQSSQEDDNSAKSLIDGEASPSEEKPMASGRKRKGPGRPPKNGIMSKREQNEMAKQAREEEVEGRRKPGKSSRGAKSKAAKAAELEKSSTQPSGKRKYTKRKKPGGEDEGKEGKKSRDPQEPTSPSQKSPTKAQKDKKPRKPPRSPSPVWDEATLTEEQLAKPQNSYVVLIHEALTNSETGQMSLPQIYRAIERKYPYFKLRVSTQGWQSSVRHNLGQHAAFKKIERDGKGWMWGIDPDVSIEKEKKRRSSPPAQSQPRYYPSQAQQARQPNYPYPVPYHNGNVPPNTRYPPGAYPQMGNGYQAPSGMHHAPLPPRPPYSSTQFPLILNPQATSYQSPYEAASNNAKSRLGGEPSAQMNGNSRPNGQSMTNGYGNLAQNYNTQPLVHPVYAPVTAPDKESSPLPQWGPSASKIPTQALAAVTRFRNILLNDMRHNGNAMTMIDSAIARALDPSKSSEEAQSMEWEKAIMEQVRRLLNEFEKPQSDPSDTIASGTQPADTQVAEAAENAVKNMPRPTSTPDGQSPSGPPAQHKRSPTSEAAEVREGKKRSLS